MSTPLREATAYSLQDDIMNLLKKDYFYGHVVLQLRREERRDLETTMAVGIQGGLTLYYNPAHLIKYEAPQRLADLKHEVLHILNRHFARRTDLRNNQTILKITTPLLMAEVQKIPDDCFKRLYNYAADMAINQYIADISEDSLFPSDFNLPDGLSTEEYFVSLVENLIKDSKQQSTDGPNNNSADKGAGGTGQPSSQQPVSERCSGNGDNRSECCTGCSLSSSICGNTNGIKGKRLVDDHSMWDGFEADRETATAQTVVIVKECHKRGVFPGSMESIVKDILQPKVNWKAFLRTFISSCKSCDTVRTWSRLNRRLPHVIKGKKRHDRFNLVLIADTSMSTFPVRDMFLAEITGVARECDTLTVMEVDAAVQAVYEFDETRLKKSFKGNGGTAFTPAFDYLKDPLNLLSPDAVIYLTDGYGDNPPPFRKCPVLWVVSPDGRKPVAWGHTLFLPH
ncbi:MAG: VWA-like domain-containing protein [Nitrospirota bacterium]|nr:VWA-like domain-containing protein [Nitrospirota bacterium]